MSAYEVARDGVLEVRESEPDTGGLRAKQAVPGWGEPESLHRARVALASTKQGREVVAGWREPSDSADRRALEAMWGKNPEVISDYLDRVLAQGADTAEVNEKVRKLATNGMVRFQHRVGVLFDAFKDNWRWNAGVAVVSAGQAVGAFHFDGQTQWQLGVSSAMTLGMIATRAWKDSHRRTWQRSAVAAHESLSGRIDMASREDARAVKEQFERDVAAGTVAPPPKPSAETKAAYRDAVREVFAGVA